MIKLLTTMFGLQKQVDTVRNFTTNETDSILVGRKRVCAWIIWWRKKKINFDGSHGYSSFDHLLGLWNER